LGASNSKSSSSNCGRALSRISVEITRYFPRRIWSSKGRIIHIINLISSRDTGLVSFCVSELSPIQKMTSPRHSSLLLAQLFQAVLLITSGRSWQSFSIVIPKSFSISNVRRSSSSESSLSFPSRGSSNNQTNVVPAYARACAILALRSAFALSSADSFSPIVRAK
jgi:hypothetical protein